MATGTIYLQKSDAQLQQDVQEELIWDPSVDATHVGIIVKNGVVTITGQVSTYFEKRAAERAAARVSGVKAIAEEINVEPLSPFKERADADIAKMAVNALESHAAISYQHIKPKVENGVVALMGEVDWYYQKQSTENVVQNLPGVRGVTNRIRVKPKLASRASPAEIKAKIETAFARHARLDARQIDVSVRDGTVTLKGNVPSYVERYEAEEVAWAAPGVIDVANQLVVS